MKYILIDRKDFTLELADTDLKESVFVIPLEIDSIFRDLSPIENAIYYGVLYPAKRAEDKLKYPNDEKKGIHRGYKLAEPQPWLIALGFIIWQGIVQGLSWDIVKLSVQQALNKLASFGLAPADLKTQKKLSKERQVGFSWIKYGVDGKKQHEMFLGLKNRYERMSERERQEVDKSIIKPKSK